jgi:hypothetical protein
MSKDFAAVTAAATGNGKGLDIDIEALIRASRRAERTVPICLRGDLVAEFEDLERQLEDDVNRATPLDKRLGQTPPGHATAEKMLALREQMGASTVVFRLRALAPSRWAELRAEHPPRKAEDGSELDADSLGINIETFFKPLVRESVVYPVLTDTAWSMLLGEEDDDPDDPDAGTRGLSNRQFEDLSGAAWVLNRAEVSIPFSRAASRILASLEPE